MKVVNFVHMDKGTKEEYDLLMSRERAHKEAHHVDNVLALLKAGDLPGMVPIIDADFSADGKPFAVTPVVESVTVNRGELSR